MRILPLQQDLHPAVPNIYFHADYQEFHDTLIKINEILTKSGLENQLVDNAFNRWIADREKRNAEKLSHKECVRHWKNIKYALRCNIARCLTGESLRKFSIRLVDSELLQWFTGISTFGYRKAVSKSSLNRYGKLFDEDMLESQIRGWQASFLSDKKKR